MPENVGSGDRCNGNVLQAQKSMSSKRGDFRSSERSHITRILPLSYCACIIHHHRHVLLSEIQLELLRSKLNRTSLVVVSFEL